MADSTQANGVVVAQGTASDEAEVKLYTTRGEAEVALKAMTDAPKSMRPFEVLKGGASRGWVLARGYDHAMACCAKLEGYTVSTGAKVAAPTKESVAGFLAGMPDDERAKFLAQYLPAPAAPKGRKN